MDRIVQNNCDLCILEGVEKYELAYLNKEMTAEYIKQELKVNGYKWRNHINNHIKPQVALQLNNRAELADQVVDKIGEIVNGLDDVKELLGSMKSKILASTDPNYLKLYLATLAELRHYVLDLQKIQGDFKETNMINVQNMHVEYNQFAGKVLQYACPKCKPVFAEQLKDIIKKVDNN